MILPTYNETQILDELLRDNAYLKKVTKKFADSYLRNVQKKGQFIRDDEYHSYHFKTNLHNSWFVTVIYNQKQKIPWRFCACCIVEGKKKTKDYYVVRGINTEKPYYIQYTTHALKRFRERNKADCDIELEHFATNVFVHRETAVAAPFVDIKYSMLLSRMDDAAELSDLSYFVLCNMGIFYASKTPMGNFIFKTYVSVQMGLTELKNAVQNKHSKWYKEACLLFHVTYLHQYFNKWLYDEDVLEAILYSKFSKDETLELLPNSGVYLLKH